MAKGIAINGQLRGKIGGTVYYRFNGEQISRARNFKPNNPQTLQQMMQRLALANASKASKGLKEIIDHSFEGIRYGADSVRFFESKAQQVLRAATPYTVGVSEFTPFVPMDALGFPVAEYLISTGSLNPVNYTVARDGVSGIIQGIVAGYAVEGATIQTLTVREFLTALGVAADAQLTFVYVLPQESIGGASSETIFNDNILSKIVRLNFNQEKLDEVMLTDGGNIKSTVLIGNKSTNADLLLLSISNGTINVGTGDEYSAVAVIASRFVDGMWRRSTEVLKTAATNGSADTAAKLEYWGWNWLDEIQKTLTKGASAAEDRLLNKEPNSDIV